DQVQNPSVLLGGVPLDELSLAAARTAVLVQDKGSALEYGRRRARVQCAAGRREKFLRRRGG
ncbi:hypothetical protein, partial [Streptomyces sp. NPDC002346]